jgi:hypothetical protein
MTNSELYTLNPFDIQIECRRDADGRLYLPLKKLCDAFGLNHKLEKAKVKRRAYLLEPQTKPFYDNCGRPCNMLCISERKVHGWLYTLNPNDFPVEWREKND